MYVHYMFKESIFTSDGIVFEILVKINVREECKGIIMKSPHIVQCQYAHAVFISSMKELATIQKFSSVA